MKCFVVDFKSVSFSKFKAHGGGDFALRIIEFFMLNKVTFFIINNDTDYYKDFNLSSSNNFEKIDGILEICYFNPLYQGGDNNDFNYSFKYLYIHGVRMLEMPYDKYSYKYFSFPNNVLNYVKNAFLNNYYKKKANILLTNTKQLKGNVKILTPSEHSKYIFKSIDRFDKEVLVLPPFLNKPVIPDSVDLPFNDEQPFILFLNADRWVKNSYRFLKAYNDLILQKKLKNVKLVMVGKPLFAKEFSNEVVYLDYLGREKLEWLMKNAMFLAYPSLNEGFGYPPVDSMKYNTPVLCTGISATNIVYNGSVVFVNPFSIDEIKSRILYMVDNLDTLKKENLEINYKNIEREINDKWIGLIS